MKSTPEDPVLAEIRGVRRELSERFGDDIDALCDFLSQEERQLEDRLVNHPPNAPRDVRAAGASRK